MPSFVFIFVSVSSEFIFSSVFLSEFIFISISISEFIFVFDGISELTIESESRTELGIIYIIELIIEWMSKLVLGIWIISSSIILNNNSF